MLNKIDKSPRLDLVVMPLVRLLKSSGLSWALRVEIAEAIREVARHHKSMEDEAYQQSIAQSVGMQQGLGAIQAINSQADPFPFKSGV